MGIRVAPVTTSWLQPLRRAPAHLSWQMRSQAQTIASRKGDMRQVLLCLATYLDALQLVTLRARPALARGDGALQLRGAQ